MPKSKPVNEPTVPRNPSTTTNTHQGPGEQTKSVLTIIGDSMIRNVQMKPQGTEVRKFTMSGARIEDIGSRLPNIIGNTKPDTLIIHVGTNNLVQDSIEELRRKYCSLLRQTNMPVLKLKL